MRARIKPPKRRLQERFKKIREPFPSYGNSKTELDKTYKYSKETPSLTSMQKMSSKISDIFHPKNIDDAKIKLLCTTPKEMKYAWDVLMKYQLDENNEK